MNIAIDPEKLLIDQCLQKNPEAWHTFIKKYSPLVYYSAQKVLRSKCPDIEQNELGDLHNDIFLSLMDKNGRKLRQYEGKNGCSVATWIRVIAVRATLDFLKKRRPNLSLSDEASEREAEKKAVAPASPLQMLEEEEKYRLLKKHIDRLPPRDQLFIRLFYFEGVSSNEIAKIFKTSPNAVYSRGNYLREKLKDALQKKTSKKKG
ncbi:MAG: sigma-70 family RNA polymerase sigma factor [Pseudomonadota bacterium]